MDRRRGGRAHHLGHAGAQPAKGADRGDRGELVGGGGDANLGASEHGVGVDAEVAEGAEVVDQDGDGAAELLGVGGARVVVAGGVDGDDAEVVVAAEALAERGEVDVDGRLADRVGAEAVRPGRGGERVGGLSPAWAGVEDDGRHVEQHAVERGSDDIGRDLGDAGEVEHDRRGAPLELLDGSARSRRGVDDLANVPRAASSRRPQQRVRCIGSGVERLDRDAVVRRRPQPVEGGVGLQPQRLGDGVEPVVSRGASCARNGSGSRGSARQVSAVRSGGGDSEGEASSLPAANLRAIANGERVQSGVTAAASGVAPVPARPWRRSIHTVGRPTAFAGTWSW